MPAIEICELKPLLIQSDENFPRILNIQQSAELDMKKDKVENIVHIVVETPNTDSEHSFHNQKTNLDELVLLKSYMIVFNVDIVHDDVNYIIKKPIFQLND